MCLPFTLSSWTDQSLRHAVLDVVLSLVSVALHGSAGIFIVHRAAGQKVVGSQNTVDKIRMERSNL